MEYNTATPMGSTEYVYSSQTLVLTVTPLYTQHAYLHTITYTYTASQLHTHWGYHYTITCRVVILTTPLRVE